MARPHPLRRHALLLVPLFALAQTRWSAQDIYLFVAAFGAMGHHLPGMIRAYGDRALFERFRWRFIFAPIFLLAVCIAFTWWDLKGIVLVVFFWGVWHGMMQTYGFCRIYDAKMGSFAALTRRLDFATCAIWFAAAVLLSSQTNDRHARGLLREWRHPSFRHGSCTVRSRRSGCAAIAVSILFLANFARMWWVGKRPNPVKLALLATSISFWWYCNNGVTNILAGIALFEVFHDVQYLSLVWIYNRNRVEKDSSIGGFMRFVFRRSGSLDRRLHRPCLRLRLARVFSRSTPKSRRSNASSPAWWPHPGCSIFIMMGSFGKCANARPASLSA